MAVVSTRSERRYSIERPRSPVAFSLLLPLFLAPLAGENDLLLLFRRGVRVVSKNSALADTRIILRSGDDVSLAEGWQKDDRVMVRKWWRKKNLSWLALQLVYSKRFARYVKCDAAMFGRLVLVYSILNTNLSESFCCVSNLLDFATWQAELSKKSVIARARPWWVTVMKSEEWPSCEYFFVASVADLLFLILFANFCSSVYWVLLVRQSWRIDRYGQAVAHTVNDWVTLTFTDKHMES